MFIQEYLPRGQGLHSIPRTEGCYRSFRCRVSARQPRSFCFGKRTQNHVGRGMALRVPSAVHRHRQRANSLRSNNARLFSGAGCTARPCHQARDSSRKKVAKTIDAPSGLIEEEGRQPCGERTNSLRSNKARTLISASLPRASRQASDQNQSVPRHTRGAHTLRTCSPESAARLGLAARPMIPPEKKAWG